MKFQVTIAHLKEKPAGLASAAPSTPSSGIGVRSAAVRWLAGANGTRGLNLVGGNGVGKATAASPRVGGSLGSSIVGSNSAPSTSNYDGKGTYLIFNVGDTLFISDFNSPDKVSFSISEPWKA